MLGYALWHWKRPEIAAPDYETGLREFHAALARDPVAGYVGSVCVAVSGARWANGGKEAYEDWYLVEGSSVLDDLNNAAVTGPRAEPHRRVAAWAAGAVAGLYSLKEGRPPPAPTVAFWLDRPRGMSYERFSELWQPSLATGRVALWCRFLVLGPTPEFCAHAAAGITVPLELTACVVRMHPIWERTDQHAPSRTGR